MPFTEENRRELIEEGWTVVRAVLDQEEAARAIEGIWDAICGLSPGLDRNDPTTWPTNWPDNIHGIVQFFGLGHCQALWDVRQNPKVVDVFVELYRKLWGLELDRTDLSCSFDAFCFQKENVSAYRNSPWVHTDQAPSVGNSSFIHSRLHPGLKSVQGVVNLMNSGPSDGGLWLYPKSHLVHQGFFEKHGLVGKVTEDWYSFSKNEDYLRELEVDASPYLALNSRPHSDEHDLSLKVPLTPIKVCVGPGDIMLFDSRVHHQAVWPDGKAESRSTARLRRAVTYVCMSPKSWQTDSSRMKRRESMALFKTTSHCPHNPKLFQDSARFANGRCSHFSTPPVLTELGRSLAGLGKDEPWPTSASRLVRGKIVTVRLDQELRDKREQKRQNDVDIKANKKSKKSPSSVQSSPKSPTKNTKRSACFRGEKKPRLLPVPVKRKTNNK